jgi:hypothetical protein
VLWVAQMADTKVSALAAASALTGAELVPVVQSATSKVATVDQIITAAGGDEASNAATTTPGAGFATDTYLVGSACAIPDAKLKAGTIYRCRWRVSKTAAGTAAPTVTVRIGTLGTTADAARLTFTYAAGTAAADTGIFEVAVTFFTVGTGTTATVEGTCELRKNTITAAGLVGQAVANISLEALSSGFDSTPSGSIIGISLNGGTSAAWTVQNVQSRLDNLI